MNQEQNTKWVFGFIALVIVGAIGYVLFVRTLQPTTTPVQNIPVSDRTPNASTSSVTSVLDAHSDWLTYVNKKYGYQFKYPVDGRIFSNQFATNQDQSFSINLMTDRTIFNVEVQDPKMYPNKLEVMRNMKLGLKDFVDHIWQINKEDAAVGPAGEKVVGEISPTIVGGQPAYQFTITHHYRDERGSYALSGTERYVFVARNGQNLMLWFPVDQSISAQILETFTFTDP